MFNDFESNYKKEDEDVLNEFRQKQVNFDIEERNNEINGSRSLFIGALAGLVMAGIAGWFILSPKYDSAKSQETIVIRRPQIQAKTLPVDPGTIDVPSQDKKVYDIIESTSQKEVVEKVISMPEQINIEAVESLKIEQVVEIKKEDVAQTNSAPESLIAPIKEVAKIEAVSKEEIKEEAKEVEKIVVKETIVIKQEVKEPAKKVTPVAEVAKKEVKETKIVATKEPAVQAPKTQAKNTLAGKWQIQVISSKNKKAVETSWQELTKKYSILANEPHNIEVANLGAKGTYYRLKVGSFAQKQQASSFCAKLKSLGGSCFVSQAK